MAPSFTVEGFISDWTSTILGSLILPPHIHVAIDTDRDDAKAKTVVTLVVRVRDADLDVAGYPIRVKARTLQWRQEVTDEDVARFGPSQVAYDLVHGILAEMAPAVREVDPRIGTFLRVEDDWSTFPRSPLFDPERLPHPEWVERDWTVNVPNERGCSICGGAFDPIRPPMWGGGNVCWVHVTCWGKGLPRRPQSGFPTT